MRTLTVMSAFVLLQAGASIARPVPVAASDHDTPASVTAATTAYAGQTPPGCKPELFAPGLISKAGNQSGLVVHPGGREIYFVVVESRDGSLHVSIRVTRLVGDRWTIPELAPFSGTYLDMYPAIHPDGSRLYFQSNRPIDPSESAFTYNIWYVQRHGDSWSEPKSMGRPINGRNSTSGPSVTRDGTIYFTIMDEKTGHSEIFHSRLVNEAYQEPERLPDQVNSRFQTIDSYVAPDEGYLLFVAFPRRGHKDNPGGLYVSFRSPDGSWSEAKNIRPLLGSTEGSNVTISPDGRFLFLVRGDASAPNGSDVYWVDSAVLKEALTPGLTGDSD